jgi:hypothetical protein
MKILHVYPAGASITDPPRIKHESVTVSGIQFYVFRAANVYLDGQTLGIRYGASDADTYFIEVQPGLITRAGSCKGDQQFAERLQSVAQFGPTAGKNVLETIPAFLESQRAIAADVDGYSAKCKADIAARRAEREIDNARVKAEREERERKARIDRIERTTREFLAGESLDFSEFEELCDLHGIRMPIQTLGSARKSVSAVTRSSMTVRKGKDPQGVLVAALALSRTLGEIPTPEESNA